jgi:PAS domain S-box-containing protein
LDHASPPILNPGDTSRARRGPTLLNAILRTTDGLLDVLPVATFLTDAQGRVQQYNRHAADIWGRTPSVGESYEAFTAGARFYETDGTHAQATLLAGVLATGLSVREVERRIQRPDGKLIAVSISIEPLRNSRGEMVGAVQCMTDVTERQRMSEALHESRRAAREQEQRLAATYEHAAIGIAEIAPDGGFVRVNEAICGITGRTRDELMSSWLFRYTHAADVDADRDAFRKQVVGDLDFYSIEKRFRRADGRMIWVSVRSSPVRAADGTLLYVVRVVQDITERKQAELRQKLLLDELNHRVKNTLATVQSLASQTARSSVDPTQFTSAFEGRLIALSKAHDQLTRHHWESADLRSLLAGSLAPYAEETVDRVGLRGEDLVMRPRAVLTLAMTVHELTTNAAKYGALSVPGGRVEVRWQPEEHDGKRTLVIAWSESGGPPVEPPSRRSFGSRLIERSIAAELGGTAVLDFAPGGLRCEIRVPWEAASAG